MSASSTQRFTEASSFTKGDCSWGGLTKPERESTEGSAVSRFVGEGNGRQITTLFFARATGQKSWMLTNGTELVPLFNKRALARGRFARNLSRERLTACHADLRSEIRLLTTAIRSSADSLALTWASATASSGPATCCSRIFAPLQRS